MLEVLKMLSSVSVLETHMHLECRQLCSNSVVVCGFANQVCSKTGLIDVSHPAPKHSVQERWLLRRNRLHRRLLINLFIFTPLFSLTILPSIVSPIPLYHILYLKKNTPRHGNIQGTLSEISRFTKNCLVFLKLMYICRKKLKNHIKKHKCFCVVGEVMISFSYFFLFPFFFYNEHIQLCN